MKIEFWGVRGSAPICQSSMMTYGCNTSCIVIEVEGKTLVFDAGTGIYRFGQQIKDTTKELFMFFTHTHFDHIQGLTVFAPLYDPTFSVKLFGESKMGISFKDILGGYIRPPYFPVDWSGFNAQQEFINIEANESIVLSNDLVVVTHRTAHPGGNIIYRVNYKGKSCCYITDLSHLDINNESLIAFAKDSDVIIYDSFFTEEEYNEENYLGWGHSTWEKGVQLAKDANVNKVVLTHHAIFRTDEDLDKIGIMAKERFENAFMAKEGMVIDLTTPQDCQSNCERD